ncbi:conserved hypothetical protein [Methanocella paludicola SANAE]|uniref:Metal-dependent hydrolase n=1 Tax=Methanocella paludicola (strain DSM 17711 / JCM 13418 / NBRC 101707 / SANAE) TaxID=304371 RepID=D1YWZ9_METPS|nr:metal-dependent hydrolase [Methanocella paludicola]BAI60971.1 conserved hypothetical protein [Methanocella paludicola SANAE]
MLFFGHIGITLGVFLVIFFIVKGNVDYRLVIIGSILPDIIDKPLYLLLYGTMPESGRFLGHTILFVLILIGLAIVVYRDRRYAGLFALPVAALLHIIQDEMWEAPRSLFWPLMGFDPKFKLNATFANSTIPERTIDYSASIIHSNSHNLYTYQTEFIGIIILSMFAFYYKLYVPANLKEFILHGTLNNNH